MPHSFILLMSARIKRLLWASIRQQNTEALWYVAVWSLCSMHLILLRRTVYVQYDCSLILSSPILYFTVLHLLKLLKWPLNTSNKQTDFINSLIRAYKTIFAILLIYCWYIAHKGLYCPSTHDWVPPVILAVAPLHLLTFQVQWNTQNYCCIFYNADKLLGSDLLDCYSEITMANLNLWPRYCILNRCKQELPDRYQIHLVPFYHHIGQDILYLFLLYYC